MTSQFRLLLFPIVARTLLSSARGVQAEPCSLCANPTDAITFPDKQVEVPDYGTFSCQELEQTMSIMFLVEDEECQLAQTHYGSDCGCLGSPMLQAPCGLCDSYNRSAKVDNFVGPQKGGGTSVSVVDCPTVHDFLKTLENNSTECMKALGEWSLSCGCKTVNNKDNVFATSPTNAGNDKRDGNGSPPSPLCSLCRNGASPAFPDFDLTHFLNRSVTRESMAGLESISHLDCTTVDGLLRDGLGSDLCDSPIHVYFAGMCGCPPVSNGCRFCPRDEKIPFPDKTRK